MKALIRLADRRGIFKGDLDPLQNEALQWLLIDEAQAEADKYDTQLRFTVLSGMNPQLYKTIWKDDDNQEAEWITPRSQEEIDILESLLQGESSESTSPGLG